MELFGSNIFSRKREVKPIPPSGVPGVSSSTMEQEPKVQGGDYQERIAYVRGPQEALCAGTLYRAVNLRGDTMSAMPVQYQKRDFEKGNYQVDCTCGSLSRAVTTS
jgi:hypothetical protein